MRIGINATVIGSKDTGVEVWTRGLIRALGEADSPHEYVVYVRKGVDWLVGDESPANVHLRPVGLVGESPLARIIWEESALPHLCYRDQLDLLHCPAYVAPHWVPIPTVVTLHDLFVYTHPECCRRRNRHHFRVRMPHSVRQATRLHCTSEWTRRCLRERFPGARSRARVVHPAVDDIFCPLSERRIEDYRKENGYPKTPYLFVGNLEPKKNLDLLLRAYARYRERRKRPEKLMLVGGEGWSTAGIGRTIESLGMEDDVIRPGYVKRSELPLIYGMSRALVFPSVIEGFGLPPLEAMACGTPVISTGAGGLSESVGEAALMVRRSQTGELVDAMKKVAESVSVREQLSRAGLLRASRFRWDQLVDNILEIYDEAVASSGKMV